MANLNRKRLYDVCCVLANCEFVVILAILRSNR